MLRFSYIAWESSKPDVVEIDEKGRFVAKAYGNAVITALADYGDGKPVKATMSVSVSERFNERPVYCREYLAAIRKLYSPGI